VTAAASTPFLPMSNNWWRSRWPTPHRTEAPLELTIDAHDDVVRVEVHDQAPRVALGLEEHPGGRRDALAPATGGNRQPRSVGGRAAGERDQVLWAELRSGDNGG
jgi:hypothetical protein